MVKKFFFTLIIFLLVFLIFIHQYRQQRLPQITIKTDQGVEFYLEVADSELERTRGLMRRTHLGERHGMLFVFNELGFYSFWLRNTFISLDLLWLNEQGQIVDSIEQTTILHGIYYPKVAAKYVIELPAGSVRQWQLMGQKFELAGIID